LLFTASFIFAILTIVTHVAQIFRLTFSAYAILVVIALIAALLIALGWSFRQRNQESVSGASAYTSILLLFLGLLCAYITVAQYRPSGDDFYYLPNAVYHLEHPAEPLDFQIHFLYSGDQPFQSMNWATSMPYEYAQAALSASFHMRFLDLYYVILPALTGFLFPIALFYLVAQFTDNPLDAVLGVGVGIGILLLLSDTQRAPLNFSLARLSEGKVLAVSIGIPLFAAQSIRLFRAQLATVSVSVYEWGFLFAITVWMVGTTSSTVVLLVPLWILLALAQLVTTPNRRLFFRRVITYAAAMIYVVIYALVLFLNRGQTPDYFSAPNAYFPATFGGQLSFLINTSAPLTIIAALVSGGAAIILSRGANRKFLLTWIVADFVLFLNPLSATVLIRYVTTQNLYWRLFYLIPIPFLVAVAAAQGLQRLRSVSSRAALVGGLAMAFALVVAHVLLPFSTFRQAGFWPWSIGGGAAKQISLWKLAAPVETVDQVNAIIAVAPSGVMLAPFTIAGLIPVLSSNYPQLRDLNDGTRFWLDQQGRKDEAELRIQGADFLDGDDEQDFPSFQSIVGQYKAVLSSIVCSISVCNEQRVQTVFKDNGFSLSATVGSYAVYTRTLLKST